MHSIVHSQLHSSLVWPPLSFSNLIIRVLPLHCSQAKMSVISGDESAFDRPDTRDLTVVVDTVYLTLSATVRPKIHRIFCCRSREAGKTADICTIADNNMADVLISVQIRNYMVHRTHPQAHRATVWSRLLRINSWHKN